MSEAYAARTFNEAATLPEELTEAAQWIVWQYVPGSQGWQWDGSGKPDKVPVHPYKLHKLSWGNRSSWMTFDDALAAYRVNPALNGIGIVLTPELGLVGVDMDHAIDRESGAVSEWAQEHLRDFDSYAEVSVGGNGFRVFVRGSLPDDVPKKVGDREIYDRGRFLTVTGVALGDDPVADDVGAIARYVGAMQAARTERAGPVASDDGSRSNAELLAAIIRGDELHDSSRDCAYRLLDDGMKPGKVVEFLRGAMINSAAKSVDSARWQERYDDIPRLVRDAEVKLQCTTSTAQDDLAEAIRSLLTPANDIELEAAKAPHPHAFMRGDVGIFPEREVSIVGAPGREGKTTVIVGVLARYVLGLSVAGLLSRGGRAVILSAEDDRSQYMRKLGAQLEGLPRAGRERLKHGLLIPDMHAPVMRGYRQLVAMIDRNPAMTRTIDAIVAALRPLVTCADPIGLVAIETASTWNAAGEDNPGQRAMAEACKRIAGELGVAVVLVHHTSQAASNNLPTLDISANDIRGGTALTFNTRQNWLLVNLGSVDEPFPSNDARTALRDAIAPDSAHRITALICLDSSKSEDPAPIFLRWERGGAYGPRAVEIDPPAEFAGLRWRKVHALLRARRASAREEAKEAAADANVRLVIECATRLAEEGVQATARAISVKAGRSPGWAAPYLSTAVADGSLMQSNEAVPRVKGLVAVYRPTDSSVVDESVKKAA